MIFLARPARRLALMAVVLLVGSLVLSLAACNTPNSDTTLTIATVFPETGADAAVGLAMQRAVDLAAQQNATPAAHYHLTVTHIDEASSPGDQIAATLAANKQVIGIVGPLGSDTAAAMLPDIEQNGIATISPGATLPGLTLAAAAKTEGLSFAQLHPQGKPVAFFRLAPNDNTLGKASADLMVAPASAHGLSAGSVYIVDDGTASGKAVAAAFAQELKARGKTVAGQRSLTLASGQDNAQSLVSSIVEAFPDAVFYAGDVAGGADLRSTLSLSGAPQMPILAAGQLANDPTWSATVGVAPAAAYTTGLLPAPDVSTLANAKSFTTAYQSAYPGKDLLPQSALAYDAAMDEITAIQGLLKANQQVTRAAVTAAIASAKYAGVTGTLAFDANGDSVTPLPMSVYSCDLKGNWSYKTSIGK